MPELPEVETIARYLREGGRSVLPIPGKVIRTSRLLWARTLAEPSPRVFSRRLAGQQVEQIGRRGKFLLIHLEDATLLVHLRMSGDIRVETDDMPIQPHDRLILHFEDGTHLAFNDPRKFGRVWLLSDPSSLLGGLGPEPMDAALDSGRFHAMLRAKKRQLKPLLLDQSFLAGLGNIYTDEALFQAGIHPLSQSALLSLAEAEALLESIRCVLCSGIEAQGASIDWVYRGGNFQNTLQVYQRTGAPCPRCGTPIERIVIGQRSSHFCPQCQIRH